LGSLSDELSLVFVDDNRMADLNLTYLNRQGPTNVIAFPMREGDLGDLNPHLLGDVVISMDTCAREAQEAELSLEERLDQLMVHGILHLFGYDHVLTESEARIMEAKSQELLTMLQCES
jgi:probable rRNA maturation factor